MPRKPVPTIHPLAMAKSLEAQNDAFGVLVSAVQTFIDISRRSPASDTTSALTLLEKTLDRTTAAFWPDEGEG